MKKLSVCLSPKLFECYNTENNIIVIIDLFRATSVISTAFEFGISKIIPVTSLEDALKFKNKKNHILAAERNTKLVEGFNYGNSPYHYMKKNITGKTLVLTTTNGTKAINLAKGNKIITASYINFHSVVDYLESYDNDVTILCSGWKNFLNLEDTILAGHIALVLMKNGLFSSDCESVKISTQIYLNSRNDVLEFLSNSAYRKRNNSEELIRDTEFCLRPKIKSQIIPMLEDNYLIPYKFQNK